MTMGIRPLNLSDAERIGCRVTFNANRFEVYGAPGSEIAECRLTVAYGNVELREQITFHGLTGAMLDAVAMTKYLAGVTDEWQAALERTWKDAAGMASAAKILGS